MQRTLGQPKSGKSLVKQIFTGIAVVFSLIIVAGYFLTRLQFEPGLFRQPFYRLNHQVFSVQDIGHSYPSREVAIALNTSENSNPREEALACVQAFEIRSLQDGQSLTCRVFQNEATYNLYQKGEKGCVIAEAVQGPYGRAENTEVRMND
ncbi:hypothetical protein [Deinococcus sp.]|uniref:hypothetical protein n=1 Tax=Deinococcus sp. TaxID=47478 RepID=UPI0025C27717|nr:hypothetical protein [Deinococcus sp.]